MKRSWTSPFVKLAALQSRVPSNNGGSTDPVALALARCAAAEENLENARGAARAAARSAGKKISGLFSESAFIRRESGERWADEAAGRAHAEGKQAAYEELTRVFCRINGVDYEDAVARAKISAKISKEDSARKQAEMRNAGFFDAVEAGDLKRAGRILNELLFPGGAQSSRRSADTARQIIAAGVRARSDGADERPGPEGLAKLIVNSGRKRRGEKEID
jgi:hypothetical protein